MLRLFRAERYAKLNIALISVVILICIAVCVFIGDAGIILPVAVIAFSIYIAIQLWFIYKPIVIVWVLVCFSFTFMMLIREVGGGPFGILQEVLLIIGFLTLVFNPVKQEWEQVNNDLCKLLFVWLLISILEVANPAGASVQGWLQEIRAAAIYPFFIVFIGFLVIKKYRDLNTFLYLVLGFSILASLNGLKQLYIGLSAGEQQFLDEGANITHVLFGRLRVFSFYSDAGQFGSSQAHIGLIALILALGPFKMWKRVVLLLIALISIYGMLISGTRGAIFGLIVGLFSALILTKKFKIMLIGGFIACCCLFVLKYTYIGNSNYQINRLRTAFDPQEASFNVRLDNQAILREYLKSRPLGGGLGVIGVWGEEYNSDKFLSTVAPDSYWVKVWAMYGIVGFIIWIGIMMYILGKCCGILWHIQDEKLKIKLLALTAGFAGILICSYGNEVINTAPSSYIVYLSWVFVFLGPKFEEEIKKELKRSVVIE